MPKDEQPPFQEAALPPPIQGKPDAGVYYEYDYVADKIGFLPSKRKEDNAFQAKATLTTALALAVVGAILPKADMPWYMGALLGFLIGMALGVFVSGAIIGYRNLRR